MTTPKEVGINELDAAFVEAMTNRFGKPSEQRFLAGTYGITAFEILEPPNAGSGPRRVLVFSHGLGLNAGTFKKPFLQTLAAAGYTVLAYSLYGHGWSDAGDEVLSTGWLFAGNEIARYDTEMHLTQVKELFQHVMEPGEAVEVFCGFSTGGAVGVRAAQAGIWPIRNLALVSPALWGVKSGLASVLEALHPWSTSLLNNTFLISVVESEIQSNNDKAFGQKRVGWFQTEYVYPEAHQKRREEITLDFKWNPQLSLTVNALVTSFLTSAGFTEHQEAMKELVQRQGDTTLKKVGLFWGDLDVIVPYENAETVVGWNPDKVSLTTLVDFGHESIAEDAVHVAQSILAEFP